MVRISASLSHFLTSAHMLDSLASQEPWARASGTMARGRILKFVFHHSEVSGFFPSNQSPRANAQPKIAVSRPLMEFTHGESLAENGEDGGAGGGARR